MAHFCNTMLPAKTFYLEAFVVVYLLGFSFDLDFSFHTKAVTCSALLLGTCEAFEEDCFAIDEWISIFSALNRGDYVEKKKK